MIPLTRLKIGQSAEVIAIDSRRPARLARLSIYGLVPGSRVTLRQRHFACVIAVDETEIALDHEVARDIIVVPL